MAQQRPARSWRRRIGLPLALVGLTAAVGAVGVVNATAADVGLTGSVFEIKDGNTSASAGGTLDWDSLNANPPATANASTASVIADRPSGSTDNSFGNGTKEDTPVPSVTQGSIPPNKSDLKEFGSWVEKNANGQFLHLFWTRVQDPSGTTNMDFEFNQKRCTPSSTPPVTSGCSSNGVTPDRTAGDILVTYDLSNGGTVATVKYRIWSGSAWGSVNDLDATKATGSINTVEITSTLTGGTTYSPRTFGEASVNLDVLLPPGTCRAFGGAYLKSRSSDSFTSAVKDFIAPVGLELTNCGRLVVKKVDGASAPLAGAGFTISPQNSAATPTGTMSLVAGSTSTFCIDNLNLGTTYTISETTTPGGYNTAPSQTFSTSTTGTCAGVTGATTADKTFVNTLQSGSIIVKKVDPSGNALAGAAFSATRTAPTAGSAVTIPSVNGQTGLYCLDGLPLGGTYAIAETTVPSGYNGASNIPAVSVSTQSTCAARLATTVVPDRTVTNNPAPGRINIAKVDDRGVALNGAGFTLYVDGNGDGSWQATELTAQGSPQTTANGGLASFVNVPLGTYCVVETTTPAGYATAAPQCTTVSLGSTAGTGQTITLPNFVDNRNHKVIVIVCHEGTNTLSPSSVTLGAGAGSTKTSLATGGVPAGVTEAQLCGLGGAAYGGLGHGTVSSSVDVGHVN